MTIAEKREIVNTIINLLLQLTAEEEVQEQPATSSKPVKAHAQLVMYIPPTLPQLHGHFATPCR